jgi:predicted nucleotidyltransferase
MLTANEILDQIRLVKPELQERYGVESIALFGSYSRNAAKEDSDIDIVVVLRQPKFEWLVGIQAMLEERLHTSIDIVRDGKHLRDSFRTTIRREALYA